MVGLITGWLAIGWWLWPVHWINAAPSDLSARHQQMYLALVAEMYDSTGDVVRVQELLQEWDRETLAATLSQMEAQTADPEAQQKAVALRQVLALPPVEQSLLDTLLAQKAFVGTLVLGALLLLGAVGVAAFPIVRRIRLRPPVEEADEAEEAVNATVAESPEQVDSEQTETAAASATSPQNAGQQPQAAEAAQPSQQIPDQPSENAEPQQEQSQNTTTPPPQAAAPPENQPAVQSEEESSQEPSQSSPQPQSTGEQPLEEEEKSFLPEEEEDSIEDILTNVFDEEEELIRYEVLLKGLDDVRASDMAAMSERVAKQLRSTRKRNVHSSLQT